MFESITDIKYLTIIDYCEGRGITLDDDVYLLERGEVGHLDSLYYINCSYPERLLQFHLKDYILPSSSMIKVEFKR